MWSSIHQKIEHRVRALKPGSVFTLTDFDDITGAGTASKALSRIEEKGLAEKVTRGVFWRPGSEEDRPNPDQVARALARGNRWHVSPCGETALHLSGLLPDLPKIWTYVTDGTYRSYVLSGLIIEFRHTTGKMLGEMSEKAALLIQIIKAYGKDGLTDDLLLKIKERIGKVDINTILKETQYTTDWIAKAIRRMFSSDLPERVG